LIDFGIARLYRPGQAKDTGALGSPGYASPEQYGKAQTTPRSDIYGLGATLQTLITGKEPFEILVGGMPHERRMPAKLQEYITHMLERDAGLRPQSMAEVKQQLEQLKAELIEQKIKRTCATTGRVLRHLSFALLPILPLILIIHLINCPVWLAGLAFAIIIVGRIALGLRHTLQDITGKLQMKDVLSVLSRVFWKQLPHTAISSFGLSMLLFCLFVNSQPDSENQGLNFLSVGFILFIGFLLGIFWLSSWLEDHISARRHARARKQATQQQQQ